MEMKSIPQKWGEKFVGALKRHVGSPKNMGT